MRTISTSQARRIALGAQGMTDPRPTARVDIRHLRKAIGRLGVLQIDSVNVVARAHLLTLFARLGPFDPTLLDDAAYRRRELFESWAHMAAYAPTGLHPLLRPRMAAMAQEPHSRARTLLEEAPDFLDEVLEELRVHGPLQASELSDGGERAGPWWGWSKGKIVLEYLFGTGRVAVADRINFARRYDLAERVIPADVLALPTPTPEEAYRELLLAGARCQGIGTAEDLMDHFRLRPARARPILAHLIRDGELEEVRVADWDEPAYLDPAARVPRRADQARLLNPFDPVVWCRPRIERLYGFHYRIEIYTPEPKRQFGYYVLPFLLGEELVGRVDLKADRAAGRLMVRATWAEEAGEAGRIAAPLARELRLMADWLQLDDIVVADRGNAAAALQAAYRTGSGTA